MCSHTEANNVSFAVCRFLPNEVSGKVSRKFDREGTNLSVGAMGREGRFQEAVIGQVTRHSNPFSVRGECSMNKENRGSAGIAEFEVSQLLSHFGGILSDWERTTSG
jgi:hypothetical protein